MKPEVVVQARGAALEPADHDEGRQRARSSRPSPAPALGRKTVVRASRHCLVGAVSVFDHQPLAAASPPDTLLSVLKHLIPHLRLTSRLAQAPSFFAASRKFLTVAVGALRPSSFSPWRLTQITGTFIFKSGATSAL